MAIIQITVVPLGTATPSVGGYVAAVQLELERAPEKIRYQLTPMSTIIEGELDDLLAVAKRLHEVPFGEGAQRVSTSITIDDRRDKVGTMEQKMASVAEKLEQSK